MISVILVLYKIPLSKIRNLSQYKKFKIYIFEQEGSKKNNSYLKSVLKFNFKYFYSEKNIGLSKAVNFLINKIKTKYCLITEPDIQIDYSSIVNMKKIFNINKKYIMVSPSFKKKNKKNNLEYKIKKFIDPSCVLFNVNIMKKIKFYDEDYFFYWEDIDLMERLKKTDFKIIEMKNIFAIHQRSTSSISNFKISLIKIINFKYGELLFDFKHRNIRLIKIVRQITKNFLFLFLNIFFFSKSFLINLGQLIGILKFVSYLFIKKLNRI